MAMDTSDLTELLSQKSAEFHPHFKPGFINREQTVFQFSFTEGAPFYLIVEGSTFSFVPGEHSEPTISLDVSDHETCWSLLDGRIDGMQAFMEGKYRADGNIVLSQLLLYLFKSNDPTIAYEIQY